MAEYFTENLHYLLWSKEPENRDQWRNILAGWAGCDPIRSSELIRGAFPTPGELMNLKALTNDDEEILRLTRLLKTSEILFRNIDFLFGGLDHGMKGEYAKDLEVDLSTISRWRRGLARPSRSHLSAIVVKFSLDPKINLEEFPLFLSAVPISLAQRRQWLRARIDRLPPDQLSALFPALQRIFGGFDGAD